jgi:hypothetical protein
MTTEAKRLNRFLEKHPDATTTGFWFCGPTGDYRVTVLASVPLKQGIGNEAEAAEFVGGTPEQLIEAMRADGFEPGDGISVERVRRLCESAPCSPNIRRLRP